MHARGIYLSAQTKVFSVGVGQYTPPSFWRNLALYTPPSMWLRQLTSILLRGCGFRAPKFRQFQVSIVWNRRTSR